MADTLEIFGVEYTNVTGIIAKDDNSTDTVFLHLTDGDYIGYGGQLDLLVLGSGQLGTGRVL